ncbi:MAG: ABC transporter permease [Bryobacteraceae bacterium]|jgi:predicted permease
MATALQDLKYAFRTLLHSPGFALAAILSLALGIGANTAIFTLTNAVFLNPLAVHEPSRVLELYTVDHLTSANGFNGRTPMSFANFEDFRDQNQAFSGLAGYSRSTATLSGQGEPRQQNVDLISANYFDVLGVKLARGRTFRSEADRKPEPETVLSDFAWQNLFGRDEHVLGRTVELNSTVYTIVGVGPEGFKGPLVWTNPDVIWVPTSMYREAMPQQVADLMPLRRFRNTSVFGRLKPGVSERQALANLETIAAQLEREYPRDNLGRAVEVSSLAEASLPFRPEQGMRVSGALSAVVGFVLLIACVNLANLLLARLAKRSREMGIRTALGAGRGRLIRQLLTESLLLAAAGGLAGLIIGRMGANLLWSFRPAFLGANDIPLRFDLHVFAFTAIVAIFTGLLFGLAPALQASVPNLSTILKSGGRGSTGNWGRTGVRGLLVTFEIALALVALIGAGLLLRSMRNAESIHPGFETGKLSLFRFDLGARHYSPEHGIEFMRTALEEARATPGVQSAALATAPPLAGGLVLTTYREGEDTSKAGGVLVAMNLVSPEYFDTLRIPLRQGRVFTPFDRNGTRHIAVVSVSMAQHLWPGQDPIGRRFFARELYEVVGVVEDVSAIPAGAASVPLAYLPLDQNYQSAVSLVARADGNPSPVLKQIMARIQRLDSSLALTNPVTMPELIAQRLWAPRTGAALFGIFGLLAMLLAGVGIYGVMAYMVAQRTNEIGIRMALGARPADVLRLVVGQGARFTAAGIIFGVLAALALSRLMSGLLFGIDAQDPLTFGLVSLILGGAALLAAWLPALRAARIDPVLALRQD